MALEEASSSGSYIFHEDYFVYFVKKHAKTRTFMQRVAKYIEYLAESENIHLRHLVEVGILGEFVDQNIIEIAPFLKPHTKYLLREARVHTKIDEKAWQI